MIVDPATCTEPDPFTGSASFVSFEAMAAAGVQGPDGEYIPGTTRLGVGYPGGGAYGAVWANGWNDPTNSDIDADVLDYGWFQDPIEYDSGADDFIPFWIPSSSNPRSSTHSLRLIDDHQFSGQTNQGPILLPCFYYTCPNFTPYTAKVSPGDQIDFTMWADVDDLTHSPLGILIVTPIDSSQAAMSASIDLQSMTGSYQQFSVSKTMPAGAAYANCGFIPEYTDIDVTVTHTWDVDDPTLTIS